MEQGRLAGEVEAEKEDAAALVVQTEQVQEPRVDPAEQKKHLRSGCRQVVGLVKLGYAQLGELRNETESSEFQISKSETRSLFNHVARLTWKATQQSSPRTTQLRNDFEMMQYKTTIHNQHPS